MLVCLLSRSYETTLHSINSAVLKLSKLTFATKVYRGSQGTTLPTRFHEADEFNVRGGVEVSCREPLSFRHPHADVHCIACVGSTPSPR
jgi:hypothetical protein